MSHSPVRLPLLHPKRLLLLAAALAMLAGLFLALQSASAQTPAETPPPPMLSIGERNEDGTFTVTVKNLKYARLTQFAAVVPDDDILPDPFSYSGRPPIFGQRANRLPVLQSDIDPDDPAVPINYVPSTHDERDVPSLPFTAMYLQDGDAEGDARSTTYSVSVSLTGPSASVTSNELTLTLPPTPAAAVTWSLRQDADGKLAPSDSTELTMGIQITPNFDDLDSTPNFDDYRNLAANTQSCVAIGSSDPDGTDTPPTGACGDNTMMADAGGAELDSSSYLVITGPATFPNGSKRISLVDLKCTAYDSDNPHVSTCYARWDHDDDSTNDPVVPKLNVDSDAATPITVTASLVAKQDTSVDGDEVFYTVLDNKHGAEASDAASREARLRTRTQAWHPGTGTYYKGAMSYFGQYKIEIDTVEQLSSIELTRAPAGANNLPATGAVRIGAEAGFRLALRNANGQASQVSAVSAITLTVVGGGKISSDYCPGGTNADLSSCTVNLASEKPDAPNSSARFDAGTNPNLLAAIPFTFTAPAKPGTSTIRATVIGLTAGNFQETLEFTVSGSATALALGNGVPSILAYGTPDPVADDPATTDVDESDPGDSRDTVSIAVSATDANGNKARMPADATVRVTNPDGGALPGGSHSAQVTCAPNTDRTSCSVVIDVNAAATSPLASGLYKATVSAGSGRISIETSFNVAGNPAAVSVSISVPDAVGESGTATVNVTDAAGVPVADGEEVEFTTSATAGGVLTARVVDPAKNADGKHVATTKNGQVTAQVTIVGRGITVLTVAARTGESGTAVLNTESLVIPTSGGGPIIRYLTPDGQPGVGAPADYLGTTSTTAAAVLAMNEAASAIWLFNGSRWIRYAVDADGEAIPGSIPFSVLPGDILWFGG